MADKDENNKNGFDTGKVDFSLLFKGIGNLIDLASRLSEEGIDKSQEIEGLPNGFKGIYGISMKTLAGKPIIESFGNIKETTKGPVVEETREPIVDIFDEGNQIQVIAELPGISEEEIHIELVGDILNLTASGHDRKYAKEIILPVTSKVDSLRSTYKNGILKITIEKA